MSNVSMDQLLSIIGAKEVELQLLRAENGRLAEEVEKLKDGKNPVEGKKE